MNTVQTIPREPDIFANIRDSAPVELLGFLDQIVHLLPEGSRYRLKQVFDSLPPEGDNMQKVLELVRSQWKDIQSQEWVRIAIVGPGQTGKSSLLAALSRRQLDGSKPIFTLVDIHDEYLGDKPDETLSEKLQDIGLILLILDGQYELSKSTKELYERLNSMNRPVLVVLNKIDLVQTPRDAVRAARRRLGTSVFATSAVQPETMDQLLKAILDTDPKTLSCPDSKFSRIPSQYLSWNRQPGRTFGSHRGGHSNSHSRPFAHNGHSDGNALEDRADLRISPEPGKSPRAAAHVGGWSCRPRGEPLAETPLS